MVVREDEGGESVVVREDEGGESVAVTGGCQGSGCRRRLLAVVLSPAAAMAWTITGVGGQGMEFQAGWGLVSFISPFLSRCGFLQQLKIQNFFLVNTG